MFRWPQTPILHDKYCKGLNNPGDDEVDKLDVMDLGAMLSKRHPTDAHFCGYLIYSKEKGTYASTGEMFRVNKPAVEALEEMGFEIHTRIFSVDLDLPGHAAWDAEELEEFLGLFETAKRQEPLLDQWHAFYSTNGGARLVYVLDKPLKPSSSESIYRGLLHKISVTVLKPYVDVSVHDWTRLFRLPFVVRGGIRTWESPYSDLSLQEDAPLLNTAKIPPILTQIRKYGKLQKIEDVAPGVDEAKNSLVRFDASKGRAVNSEWTKLAKRRLKGRESLAVIQSEFLLEDYSEGRNNGLRFMVGQAVSLLYPLEGTEPRLIYGLFADAVEQLEARTGTDGGKPWMPILWHLVKHCWEKETAQACRRDEENEKAAVQTGKNSNSLLNGMLQWVGDRPEFHQSTPDALGWAQQYMIAYSEGLYYVMRPDGYYDTIGVVPRNLAARIRALGMQQIIRTHEDVVANGQVIERAVPIQKVIDKYTTITASCVGVVGRKGGTIRNLGEPSAKLQIRMYARREDITPQWSDEVDSWMLAAFGAHYTLIKHWISHALNFEGGGICALSINAPPGIGKKLIVEGLAECVDSQSVADARELAGRFQNEVLHTPFLSINEGMPKMSRDSGSDPADAFRRLIAGDTMHVEKKNHGIFPIHNPMRIIITANNDGVLRGLYQHRDLSQSDREALGKRILHFDLDEGGQEWLSKRGGLAYTAKPGKRWIRGDDGAGSDWIVARHFLSLYKHRTPSPEGNRLLVEGSPDSEIVRDMAVSSGGSPEVIEVIIDMIEQTQLPEGLLIKGYDVFVSAVGVRQHQANMDERTKPSTLHKISSVLKGLSHEDASTSRKMRPGDHSTTRCWHIDQKILWQHATEYGHTCERLESLVQ